MTEIVPPAPDGSLMLAWQVKNKHVLVVGAGDVGLSRIDHLLAANAKITVISGPTVHPTIKAYESMGLLENLIERDFKMSDLKMYEPENLRKTISEISIDDDLDLDLDEDKLSNIEEFNNMKFQLVLTCINDYKLSLKIWYACKQLGINVNLADKPKQCDFYFGSIYRKGPLQIMISTNGKSPRFCNRIKNKMLVPLFEDLELDKGVENLNYLRTKLRNEIHVGEDTKFIKERMEWNRKITDFYSIEQWCMMDTSSIDKILELYPNLPTSEFLLKDLKLT